MNKHFIIILIFILLLPTQVIAKSSGHKIYNGFKSDDYGTCYYYDEDKYYNDGWHLVDDNGDKIYEYQYFTLSGHILKDAIAPNGFLLDNNGYLLINNIIYHVSEIDIVNNNILLNGKVESIDEIKQAFQTDYIKNFDKWINESNIDINVNISNIASDLTVRKVEKIRQLMSEKVKNIRNIAKWYEDRLYDAKKDGTIDKAQYNEMWRKLQDDESIYINNFRELWLKVIRSAGY